MGDIKQDLVTIRNHTPILKSAKSSQVSEYANMALTEQRKFKAEAADKAEEERQAKLAIRVDVVYHFFAYRYFDRSAACLDLLNFTDADVDSFNLTANKTRGLNNWHVCAEYLKNIIDVTPETNTHRRRLIYKVRSFNKTQPSHFRFYLQNLTDEDIAYVRDLCEKDKMATKDENAKEMKLIWATSCVEDEIPLGFEEYNDIGDADPVELAIEKCLGDHRQKLQSKVSGMNAKKAEDQSKNAGSNDTI